MYCRYIANVDISTSYIDRMKVSTRQWDIEENYYL